MKKLELINKLKDHNIPIKNNKVKNIDVLRFVLAYDVSKRFEWRREDLFGFIPKQTKDYLKQHIDQSDIQINLLRKDEASRDDVLIVIVPCKKLKDNTLHIGRIIKTGIDANSLFLTSDGSLNMYLNLKPYEVIKRKPRIADY